MNISVKNSQEKHILYTQKANEKKLVKEQKKILPLEPTRYGDWEKNGRAIDF